MLLNNMPPFLPKAVSVLASSGIRPPPPRDWARLDRSVFLWASWFILLWRFRRTTRVRRPMMVWERGDRFYIVGSVAGPNGAHAARHVDPLDLQEPVLLPWASVQLVTAAIGRATPAANGTPSLRILKMLRSSIRATTNRPTFLPLRLYIRSYVCL
jgi:hypothetical protein